MDEGTVGQTFMTEGKPTHLPSAPPEKEPEVIKPNGDVYGLSTIQDSRRETQAQTSFIGAHHSHLTSVTGAAPFLNSMIQNSTAMKAKSQQRSPVSKYRHPVTENIKFERFIELVFNSQMDAPEIKDEILKYVQAIETNYMATITDLKKHLEKEKVKFKRLNFEKIHDLTTKNELEALFVECIEEVRKDVMRRRLKAEIQSRKRTDSLDKQTEEAKEFEKSLLKLAQLAKHRVKISDFSTKDRTNLLDLFVNNEKTLLKIYEILFPHRVNSVMGVSSHMIQESGNGVYGQNAIKAFDKSRPSLIAKSVIGHRPVPLNSRDITAVNYNLLNTIQPDAANEYNYEMIKSGGFYNKNLPTIANNLDNNPPQRNIYTSENRRPRNKSQAAQHTLFPMSQTSMKGSITGVSTNAISINPSNIRTSHLRVVKRIESEGGDKQ